MRVRVVLCSLAGALALTPAAGAHVTINPPEWEAAGFARFAVRVPNERDNANTTRVTVQFPESVVSASFMPAPGWERTVRMARLAEPIEEEGEEPVTERIASVTWSGGTIRRGEFMEFGVSFQVPETPGEELLFPSLQRYSSGEVVRWIAPDPEADTPAPRVAVLPPEEDEEEGGAETAAAEAQPPSAGANEDDEARSRANLAVGIGIAALVAGLAALALSVFRRRSA
jgi:periplasmic copper chaperone A